MPEVYEDYSCVGDYCAGSCGSHSDKGNVIPKCTARGIGLFTDNRDSDKEREKSMGMEGG